MILMYQLRRPRSPWLVFGRQIHCLESRKALFELVLDLQGVQQKTPHIAICKWNKHVSERGDHTESIEIDYDPNEISYNELLDLFWKNHDPTARTSKQYTSLIMYHNQEQKELAEKTLKEEEKKKSTCIVTKILPAKEFYDAEDYHQKYRLQQHPFLMKATGLVPGHRLKSSHLAARLNGFVVGRGGVAQFDAEVSRLGLDEKTADYVRKLVVKFEGQGLFC